jgi:hypothetical protein
MINSEERPQRGGPKTPNPMITFVAYKLPPVAGSTWRAALAATSQWFAQLVFYSLIPMRASPPMHPK